MANYEGLEVQKLTTVTSSTQQVATFDGGINALSITSDQDIYINFDGHPAAAAANQGFLVKGGVTQPQMIFRGSNVQKINVIAVSTSANVYLLGYRGGDW